MGELTIYCPAGSEHGAPLATLLENAATLWEAALDAFEDKGAPGHAEAKAWREREGMAACRGAIAALAGEVESAWKSLDDDARDGWACPFDWEFVPYWLARRMGWIDGEPCADPGRLFSVTVTRETTESTVVKVRAENAEAANDLALELASDDYGSGVEWRADESSGMQSEPYVTGEAE